MDAAGNAYIAGDTQSTDFPLLNPVQSVFGGKTDAFVTKLTPAGAISFSTYLGGSNDEHAGGIAVDASGNIYLAGGTLSTNFPVAAPLQAVNGGSQDAFVTKISTSPAALVYSTYLGGTGGQVGSPEQANAIAVDSAGSAYVAGVTNSANFPVTAGAFQTTFNGVQDAFVTKLNAAGSAKLYSTYLGSSSFDWASGIAIDSGGNAYVAGYTSSAGFPVVGGVQTGFKGFYDAFVSKLNPSGQRAHVFHPVRGHGRRSGQCHRRRYLREHVRRRPDQLARSALAGRDPVVQRRRQHRMGRAARRDGPAAAASRRELGLAVLRQRQHGHIHGSILASGGRGQPHHGRRCC